MALGWSICEYILFLSLLQLSKWRHLEQPELVYLTFWRLFSWPLEMIKPRPRKVQPTNHRIKLNKFYPQVQCLILMISGTIVVSSDKSQYCRIQDLKAFILQSSLGAKEIDMQNRPKKSILNEITIYKSLKSSFTNQSEGRINHSVKIAST